MKWGIVVEWDERGLECCRWYSVGTPDEGPAVFGSEEAAQHAATALGGQYGNYSGCDVILTARAVKP